MIFLSRSRTLLYLGSNSVNKYNKLDVVVLEGVL